MPFLCYDKWQKAFMWNTTIIFYTSTISWYFWQSRFSLCIRSSSQHIITGSVTTYLSEELIYGRHSEKFKCTIHFYCFFYTCSWSLVVTSMYSRIQSLYHMKILILFIFLWPKTLDPSRQLFPLTWLYMDNFTLVPGLCGGIFLSSLVLLVVTYSPCSFLNIFS